MLNLKWFEIYLQPAFSEDKWDVLCNKLTEGSEKQTKDAIAAIGKVNQFLFYMDNSQNKKIRPGAIMFLRGFLLSPEKNQEDYLYGENERTKMILRGIIDSFDFRCDL